MKVKSFSRVQLFETPWTAAYQAVEIRLLLLVEDFASIFFRDIGL